MDTKKLRQKILDLAIHGKLVPQDPNDEPASVLLERIKAEKERLIKEGKIKRSKKTAKTSDTPHYPYLLPNGWKWCKLEDIASFGGGKTPSMDNKEYWHNGNHLWVTSKDMKCSHITNSLMKITDKALEAMTIYDRGTLLVVTRSGILRHTLPISILESPATVNQDLKAISPYLQGLSEYLYIVIKANEHFILKEYHKDGTTVDSIDFDKFKCLPIPLPPITEQRRIIAETKHWFALIEQINQDRSDLQTIIHKVKNKILSLAIHGKLVPQNPNDEPATELIKRINPKAEITCDNGQYGKRPFEIPNSWCWSRLGDINNIARGGSPRPIKDYLTDDKNGINWIKIGDTTREGKYIDSVKEKIRPEGMKKSRFVHKGDFLLTNSMSFGRPYILNVDGCIHDGWLVISPIGEVYTSDFLYHLLSSSFAFEQFTNVASGGVVTNLNSDKVADTIFPVPPLAEQQRIVEKIEKLFEQLDYIENSLEA